MTEILVIDTVGDAGGAIGEALEAAGWAVASASDSSGGDMGGAAAVVLATDTAGLAGTLRTVVSRAQQAAVPVLLVTDLDRSGWDRSFSSSAALGVDALLESPVDAEALVRRLRGILAARAPANAVTADDMGVILDRAIANEEAAAAFYRQAAGGVSDAVTREALEDLMRDEEEHKRLIEEFRSGARALPEGVTTGGSLVETLGTPNFSSEMSPADAFLLAARKEKLAVEFYENWAGLYPAGPERELLLQLAEVERRHKVKVEAMFTNAAFPEAW